MQLKDKTVIITGASSGIGLASAKLFARAGARVVLGARRRKQLARVCEEIVCEGGHAVALDGDVGEEAFHRKLVDRALNHFGGLDVAFNNAGMLQLGSIKDTHLDIWNQVLKTNLTSGFLAAKHQIPAMQRKGGSVIFTSSFVGYTIGMPNMSAYSASKAGLIGLTKSLASDCGAKGIRVNALLPGGTKTPMADAFGSEPEVQDFVNNIHVLKRQADPEEIARAALYLASDASSFVTGTALLVDGGVSISKT